ncbi:hypothetical protein [Microbacterium elymi]|uniref:Uncharacterized protein n=1 Tax=Microbacterium elymi TaxID=2909587 RepID=A0ABY5NIT8_9MICO|nr:hypothetical protein [Microbacterium elymi]UUT35080.1 hypothetical protein L2X98_32840 [Microbacterium elymi]
MQDRATALAESAGESLSRAVTEWLGYEEPELQVGFAYEGARDRVDFYWRRLRRIGESDGYGKYDANDAAAMKAHFVVEKTREDRLRRHEGGFIRWEWGMPSGGGRWIRSSHWAAWSGSARGSSRCSPRSQPTLGRCR